MMSDMAYVIPDVVLPLAHERFQVRKDLDMMCFRTTRSQECRAVRTVWADHTLNMKALSAPQSTLKLYPFAHCSKECCGLLAGSLRGSHCNAPAGVCY